VSELEDQQKTLRAELLKLRAAGAETGNRFSIPSGLRRPRKAHWKLQALTLAEKLYGIEKAASWKVEIEHQRPSS
jgi:hypothetical protein